MHQIEYSEYDPVQAKFSASLLWFVCRVSESGDVDVPSEITSPIESTAMNSLIVRPQVSEYLVSGRMYLSVGTMIFKQDIKTLWDLIQLMSNKGIYIIDEKEEAVTDLDLMEKFPFKIFSHLALMDSIMLLYINNTITMQSVINSIRKFSTFNASKELPFDLEDSLVLWINKISHANVNDCSKHHYQTGGEKIQIRRDKLTEKSLFPVVNELIDCFSDCKSLLSILIYYLPDKIALENINWSAITDSARASNIELFRSLCAENVCTSVFALRVEEFLHASEHLKTNFLALISEIFYKLEVDPRQVLNEPTLSAHEYTMQSSSNQMQTKNTQHQPLLSKRSKKQFAKFEMDMSEDFTAKSGYIANENSTRSYREIPGAWSAQNLHPEDLRIKKQEKISLEFRPYSGSCRTDSYTNSFDVDNKVFSQNSTEISSLPLNSWTMNASYSIHPSLRNDLSYSDGVKLVEDSKTMSSATVSSNTSVFQESSRNETTLTERRTYGLDGHNSAHSSQNIRDEMTDIDEDALSTITEATEPEAPSLYSFRSSSSASTKLNSSSEERLNICNEKDDGGSCIDDFHPTIHPSNTQFEHTGYPLLNYNNNNKVLRNEEQTNHQKDHIEHVRGSYTLNHVSMESALATGLPIITESLKRSFGCSKPHYVDLSSSYEVNAKQDDEQHDERLLKPFEKSAFEHDDSEEHSELSNNTLQDIIVVSSILDNSSNTRNIAKTVTSNSRLQHEILHTSNNTNQSEHPYVSLETAEKLPSYLKDITQIQNNINLHPPKEDVILKERSDLNALLTDEVITPFPQHWPFRALDFTDKVTIEFGKHPPSPAKVTWDKLEPNKDTSNKENTRGKLVENRRLEMTNAPNTIRWIDCKKKKDFIENERHDDEPLTTRLVSLRMQLEEKRRQFEEEKKRKQILWNQERAQILKDAFFVMINGKENESPSELNDIRKTKDSSAWEVRFQQTTKLEEEPPEEVKKPFESPRDFIRRKQEEKKNVVKTPIKQGAWFVGLNDEVNESEDTGNLQESNVMSSSTDDNHVTNGTVVSISNQQKTFSSISNNSSDIRQETIDITSHRDIQKSIMVESNSTLPKPTFSSAVTASETNEQKNSNMSGLLSSLKALTVSTSQCIEQSSVGDDDVKLEIHTQQFELLSEKSLDIVAASQEVALPKENFTSNNTKQQKESCKPVCTPVEQSEQLIDSKATAPGTVEVLVENSHQEQNKPREKQKISEEITYTDQQPIHLNTSSTNDALESDNLPVVDYVIDHISIDDYVVDVPTSTSLQNLQEAEHKLESVLLDDETCVNGSSSYMTSTPMKKKQQLQCHDEKQAVDNNSSTFNDTQDKVATPHSNSWGFTFGDEFSENPGITPEQQRKRERFMKSRLKKLEDGKRKKEAELEKKRLKEEKMAEEKAKEEENERLKKERLMEEQLAETTSRLQQENFSKRLHEMTYNMDLHSTPDRRKEARPPPMRQLHSADNPSKRRTSPDVAEEANAHFSEYRGPSVYQKPSGKSNRKIIQNAIIHCCLCGEVNREAKKKCLEALSLSEASHFLVLFREGLKFRSVYEYRLETETITRIYGIGPKSITPKMMNKYFKYNSGGKEFNPLETKHLSLQVDGLMIKKELWEKKPQLSSKTNSNLRKKPPSGNLH